MLNANARLTMLTLDRYLIVDASPSIVFVSLVGECRVCKYGLNISNRLVIPLTSLPPSSSFFPCGTVI